MNNYLISCIIPIYNSGLFLKEAIQSVISQSIGFKNIQLILINDGSTDNSEKICMEYGQFSNITYIYQTNSGVSAARNKGLQLAKGEYVSFLDSDDKLDVDFYSKAIIFLQQNDVDFVAFQIKYFEDGLIKNTPIKPRFVQTKVIDAYKQFQYIHYSACSAVMRLKAVQNLRFDQTMRYCEDVDFMHRLVLQKMKYGVVRDTFYYYRKRQDSVMSLKLNDADWYEKNIWQKIIDYSLSKYGEVTKYSQYLCLVDLMSFSIKDIDLQINLNNIMNQLNNALQYIDDEIIMVSNLSNPFKIFLLKQKGKRINVEANAFSLCDKTAQYVIGQAKFNITNTARIVSCEIANSKISISGYCMLPSNDNIIIVAICKNKIFKARQKKSNTYDVYFLGKNIHEAYVFDIFMPYIGGEIIFFLQINSFRIPLELMHDSNAHIDSVFSVSKESVHVQIN